MLNIHKRLKGVAKNITVLYAEDNKSIREQYTNIFKLLFKEVKSVENGKLALDEYNRRKYDLLITDLTMPLMNGIDLIKEIHKQNTEQYIIIMTAHNEGEGLRNLIDFEVDGILLKPVSMDKMLTLFYEVSNQIEMQRKDTGVLFEDDKLYGLLENDDKALFLVVVDKFSEIKNQFGNQIGDIIFSAVGEHLSHFGIDDKHRVQLYNDVIVCGIDRRYLDHVLEALQDFSDCHNSLIVEFDNLKIHIILSYGVIIVQESSATIDKNRDFTQYIDKIVGEIKNDEHSTLVVKMDVDREEIDKTNSFRWLGTTLEALQQNSIVPFYQKLIDINSRELISYEVFARLKQDEKYILPRFFIDLSQKAGILDEIFKSIFQKSFETFSSTKFSFHLNLTGSEFKNSAIADYLVYLSSWYGIEHSRVILNIMDYASFNPSGMIVKTLLKLKSLGYKIALKEFGSENINIELLSILRPDYIKINQLLLQKSLTDEYIKYSLEFLLDYTKRMNFKSVLVEIESEEILEYGKKLGFDYVQGFLIAKPTSHIST